MSISKKLRFEVLQRDGYQCGYCGKTSQEATLEVGHIISISKGGSDDNNNLLTTCMDCRHGKTGVPLDKAPPKLNENLEVLKEKEAQLAEYKKMVKKVERRLNKEIAEVDEIYTSYFPKWVLNDKFKAFQVKKFITELGVDVVKDAMRIAGEKMERRSSDAIRYFCGICWNKIKEKPPTD